MGQYSGKIAVITGAGSGIGKALAEEMAVRGAHVIISDKNEERINKVGAEISKSGLKVAALTLNVSDYDAVKKMIDDVVKERGKIDYIFNNAGVAVGGEVRDTSIEDWRAVLDVNLYGVAAAYPIMAKQGFGHIVNTASIEGLVPFPGTTSYVASKYGVVGLSNALRVEAAPLGVKVSAVCPGYIKTRIFFDAKMANLDREKAISWMTNAPGLTPEQCAKKILSGVDKNKGTIVITGTAKAMWYAQRFFPWLVYAISSKIYKKIMEKARLKNC